MTPYSHLGCGVGLGHTIAAVGVSSGSDQVPLGQQMEDQWGGGGGHSVLLQGVHEVVQVVFCVILLLIP